VIGKFKHQAGMLTHAQALELGFSRDEIQTRLKRGTWQRTHRNTIATFSGALPRASRIWGVVLAAGRGATVSHQTAAELAGFNRKTSKLVDVTIPWARSVPSINGGRIHVSRRIDSARHPSRRPPQTRVEETVLDLTDLAAGADEAIGWVLAACGERVTTVPRLAEAMQSRKRLRWRNELRFALRDVADGAQSPLELRYLRDVERDHGLPKATRQARHARAGGTIYDDVRYPDFGLVVELDGRADHAAERRFRDLRRDNVTGARGDIVLHYGWEDVTQRPCAIAHQVAGVLRIRGWDGQTKRCSRQDCMIGGT
jgi:very-short-patch-repair endonuclease